MERLTTILSMQVWQLPYLGIAFLGLVLALTRRDLGRAAGFAASGFGLMILGMLLSMVSSYLMLTLRESGDYNLGDMAMKLGFFRLVIVATQLGSWILILLAIFAKRANPPSHVE